ncbi:MAG TPA: S41 family peptidase [Woeseiaceae bacterium]|nr:S41 family peptidase [Woeseiaceae bacterium]
MGAYIARFLVGVLGALLAGCGGGGGGSGGGGGGGSGWTPGTFLPSSSFAGLCFAPRSGPDPFTGRLDDQGTVLDENNFLRSFSDETYLWYDEITDRDPGNFNDPVDYFDLLRTTAATASGADKDKFHFIFPTDEWFQLSQSGQSVGYGAQWIILSQDPPRELVVAYTEPGSPATAPTVNLARGARVLTVDGADLVNGDSADIVDVLNAGLFPETIGEPHTFTVRDLGDPNTREITMTSAQVTAEPVQEVKVIATPSGDVGYMLFNDHIATAEDFLFDAVEQLDAAGVVDLVLDIRYNGGGFLDIASELAYMIAGDVSTAGRTFELMQFSDKHPSTNPVTGQPLQPLPFHTQTVGFGTRSEGTPLPTLDLPRVFVLTGPNTCSASEAIMNSLRGVGVDVIQIGSTTCGKPYGFYPEGNCGITWFTIQFRGVNEENFGDYTDGFSPQNASNDPLATLPGCSIADDFEHPLGDPLEGRLQTALAYRDSETCPAPTGIANPGFSKAAAPLSATDGIMPKSPWRENRIMRR